MISNDSPQMSSQDDMRHKWQGVLRWGLTLILLTLLILYLHRNRQSLVFVTSIRWQQLLPIVGLMLISFLVDGYRYFMVMQQYGSNIKYFSVFRVLMVSRFLNKLMPQSGLIYRAWALKKYGRVSYSGFFETFATFVWLDLLITCLTVTAILVYDSPGIKFSGIPLLPVMVGCSLLGTGITLFGGIAMEKREFKVKAGSPVTIKILYTLISHIGAVFTLAKQPRLFMINSFLVILNVFLAVWRILLLFGIFGLSHTTAEASLFVAINRLASVIVLTPGNLGIVEGSYGVLSGGLGMGAVEGVTAALMLRLLNFSLLTILCLLVYLYNLSRK